MILHARLTLPSCFASSRSPTLARIIFCSCVIACSPLPPVDGLRLRSLLKTATPSPTPIYENQQTLSEPVNLLGESLDSRWVIVPMVIFSSEDRIGRCCLDCSTILPNRRFRSA